MIAIVATLLHVGPVSGADGPRPRVGVEIDAGTLGTFEAPMRERVTYEVSQVFAREDVELVEGEGERDATLRVVIEFSGKSKLDYRYRVESTRAAGEADATPHGGTCDRCMREAVVKKIAADIPTELAEIREALATRSVDTATATPEAPTTTVAGTQGPAPTHADDGVPTLGKRGIAGAVLVGVGLPTLGVGVFLSVRNVKLEQDVDGDPQQERGVNTRPAGIAMWAGGAVAVGVGIALLVIDRRAAKAEGRKITAAPVAGRHWAGVVLSGRF